MQTLDLYCRLLLAIWVSLALFIGIRMIKRKEDIIFKPREGFTRFRNAFEAIYFALLAWYILAPDTRLEIYLINIPMRLKVIGMVLFIAGAMLRVESQRKLGRMWSDQIRLIRDHRIIEDGVYRYLKHPMYASYLLIAPGSFLMTGDYVLGFVATSYTMLSFMRLGLEVPTLEIYSRRLSLELFQHMVEMELRTQGEVRSKTRHELSLAEYELAMTEMAIKRWMHGPSLAWILQKVFGVDTAYRMEQVGKSVLVPAQITVVALVLAVNLIGIFDELVFAFTGSTFFMSIIKICYNLNVSVERRRS